VEGIVWARLYAQAAEHATANIKHIDSLAFTFFCGVPSWVSYDTDYPNGAILGAAGTTSTSLLVPYKFLTSEAWMLRQFVLGRRQPKQRFDRHSGFLDQVAEGIGLGLLSQPKQPNQAVRILVQGEHPARKHHVFHRDRQAFD